MNINGFIDCLEFAIELQELKKIGLTEKEIEGYLEFQWESNTDLITSIIARGPNDKN